MRIARLLTTSWVASVLVVATSAAQPAKRDTPNRPAERFTVYVFTEGLKNEDVDMPKVTREVAKRIGKKKHWLEVVDERESADFVIEVLTHTVSEQHRRELDMRVNDRGVGKNYYDNNWVTERHRIEIRAVLPSGRQKMFTGNDDRKRGGSMKRAASNFADQLETFCKENYWELIDST